MGQGEKTKVLMQPKRNTEKRKAGGGKDEKDIYKGNENTRTGRESQDRINKQRKDVWRKTRTNTG